MTSESDAVDMAYKARPRMTLSELRYLLAKTSVNDTVIPALALSPIEKFDATYLESPLPLNIATFAFYQESLREDHKRKYRLSSIRTPCQIDVNKLNKNMRLTVYGRRK